jgi:CBS domain-containing protein
MFTFSTYHDPIELVRGEKMSTLGQLADVKVLDIMTRKVVTVMPDDSIQDVAGIMMENGFSTLPVVNSHDKCIGVIARKDLTELFLEEDGELSRILDTDRLSLEWFNQSLETSDLKQVSELMNDNVSVIKSDTRLPDACREMVRNRVHHLPVVDSKEKIVGMLSTFDIVNAVAHTND